MKCLECCDETRKYKCPRCNNYCCSFDCFNKHKNVECVGPNMAENVQSEQIKDNGRKKLFQFTTDDTVDPNRLAQLAHSEPLKELLRNRHLRDFISAIDSSENAWKAMKLAMLEPLFIEFADECLNVVESNAETL